MSIKRKLMISVFGLIIVFSLISAYLISLLNSQGKQTVFALNQPLIAVTSSQHAMSKFEEAANLANAVLAWTSATSGEQNATRFTLIKADFDKHLLDAQRNSLSESSKQISQEIQEKAQKWFEDVHNYIADEKISSLKNMTLIEQARAEISALLTQFAAHTLDDANALSKSVEENTKTQIVGTIIAVSVSALLALILSLFLVSKMLKPLKSLAIAAYELSSGDGDLTRRLDAKTSDEVGTLSTEFNAFIGKVQKIIEEVATSVWSTQNQLSGLASLAETTRTGTDSQQTEIQHISQSMNEPVELGKQAKLSTELANEQANSINMEAHHGAQLAKETDAGIHLLTDRVSGTSEVILELNNASDEINEITTVIESIADQTNLLALNAAIEAARAGEAGRGFAVVAEEVRNLAMKTQESTYSIQETISKVQGFAEKASAFIKESQDKASSCIEMNSKVNESLNQVLKSAQQVNETTSAVAKFTSEQEGKILHVNEYLTSISKIADETAEGSNQLLRAQKSVNEAIETVANNISVFKLVKR
ncbi:methyl-accepting chemotaxis protein [Agaribacter flavus]|uniref:Methyl-accepting chemotaxis protein n=1 Tax=Agaribacter flavus TaxID=1902781 RepID=A0ABV7FQ76_9ALTE